MSVKKAVKGVTWKERVAKGIAVAYSQKNEVPVTREVLPSNTPKRDPIIEVTTPNQ
jgi:hypothetical protein